MAMNVQNVIDNAIEHSTLNDADLVSNSVIRRWLTIFERRAFHIAALENPDFFGKEGQTSTRGSATDTWDLTSAPGNVASITKLEANSFVGSVDGISQGDKVNIISIRHPEQGLAPRVYVRNRKIHEYNEELQDNSTNYVSRLKVFYTPFSAKLTSDTQDLELPEEWEDLVSLPLAAKLAQRDSRLEEAQRLSQQYSTIVSLFRQQVSVFDEAAERAQTQIRADALALGGGDGG